MTESTRPIRFALAVVAAGALMLPGNIFNIITYAWPFSFSSGRDFECQQITVVGGDTFSTATAVARRYCTGDIADAAKAIREGSRGEILGKGDIIQLP